MLRPVAIAGIAIAACNRPAPIASCHDDLRGAYAGPAPGERWMMLDSGNALEAYALFPDGEVAAGVVAAPRVIDLTRAAQAGGNELVGTLHRRYMRRADSCDAQVPVHVTRCAGDTLELVLADPAPPLAFAPCAWPTPGSSRVVRWRRE
jgi:hypothetical protein